MTSPSALFEEAKASTLDKKTPLVAFRGERWCCLLCERQFKSERHLSRHLDESTLHKDNISAAVASGRLVRPVHFARAGSALAEGIQEAAEPPAKRERVSGQATSAAEKSAEGMSALEQMALFESRLKSQAKAKPERKDEGGGPNVDSNKARTINNQMDWECGECGQFNFARSVICHSCKAHVDTNTKYLSNRLKELKQERFARVFGNSTQAGGIANQPFVADPAAEHAHQKAELTVENVGHGMLSSMGWRGGGLGRNGDGVATPVRPHASSGDGEGGRRASFQC